MRVNGIQSVSFMPVFGATKVESKAAAQTEQKTSKKTPSSDLNGLMEELEKALQSTGSKKVQNTQKSDEQDVESLINSISLPDISPIISEIQANPGLASSVNDLVSNYLISNFGGSSEEVLKNLLSTDKLSPKIEEAASSTFNEIVSRISTQIQDKLSSNPFG